MSRETEKIMKELQQFLALHGDEATDEESVDRLTRQFLFGMQQLSPEPQGRGPRNCRRLFRPCGTGILKEKTSGISP